MSGCAVCIYDLHADALAEYHEQMESIRRRLQAQNIPKSLWPKDLASARDMEDDMDPATKAFIALEQSIQKKHEK